MKRNTLLIFLLFATTFTCMSQQNELIGIETDEFNSYEENLTILSTINSNQLYPTFNSDILSDNSVFISQIGDYNKTYSQTQSNRSYLQLVQHGNSNEIDLNINAPSINGKVLQYGNNNSVLDYIYYTNQDVQLNVIQNGDNLSINRIGANSLSNKLQLVQEGSFKSITIISK